MNISLPAKNQWMNYYLHKKEKSMRRKDGDDERPVIHIYIGGLKPAMMQHTVLFGPLKSKQFINHFWYSVTVCMAVRHTPTVKWDEMVL